MKAYTDIDQSKKLAEILPIESADMHYATWTILDGEFIVSPNQGSTIENLQEDYGNQIIPCWSLAALINVMPKEIIYKGNIVFLEFHIWETSLEYTNGGGYTLYATESYDNPVDACVAMIKKLHELKTL